MGPCKMGLKQNKHGVRIKRAAPSCTDNFQLAKFKYKGATIHSCEHAYQAAKFKPGTRYWTKLCALTPLPEESCSSFGMRCWSAGQTGRIRDDWNQIKVQVMYEVNMAKYQAYENLKHDLVSTAGQTLLGGPSTSWKFHGTVHKWQVWNGRVQMRIREELRPVHERDAKLLSQLCKQFDAYSQWATSPATKICSTTDD